MNVAEYIKSKPELNALNFQTVYQTIVCLIGDGIVSMDDFNTKYANICLPGNI